MCIRDRCYGVHRQLERNHAELWRRRHQWPSRLVDLERRIPRKERQLAQSYTDCDVLVSLVDVSKYNGELTHDLGSSIGLLDEMYRDSEDRSSAKGRHRMAIALRSEHIPTVARGASLHVFRSLFVCGLTVWSERAVWHKIFLHS